MSTDTVTDGVLSESSRPLGGFEWLFYTLGQAKAFNITLTLTLSGPPIPHATWTAALAHLQSTTAALNVTIQRHPQHGLAFTPMPADSRPAIPITFHKLQHAGQWCEVAGRELSTGFDVEAGPLLRLVVLEGADSSEVVVTCHHAIGDGVSFMATVRQLLNALNLDTTSAPPASAAALQMPAAVDDRATQALAVPEPTDDTSASTPPNPITGSLTEEQTSQTAEPEAAQPQSTAAAAQPPPQAMSDILGGQATVHCLTLSAELTAALRQKARQEQATVHTALCAAVALALRRLNPATASTDIQICSPYNIRPMLGMDESLSFAAGGATPSVPAGLSELWAIARDQLAGLKAQQNPQQILATFAGMRQLASMQLPAEALVPIYNSICRFHANVTNLREVAFDTHADSTYGGATVTAVYGPGTLWGGAHEQVVGVVTYNGCLRLMHSSYTPLTGLLEAVQHSIEAAM